MGCRPIFSYIRPFLYFDRSTSTFLVRLAYFDLFISARLLRLLHFDLLSNLDLLLVEKHGSKYSLGRSKVAGSNCRKGRSYETGRSTEKVKLMRTRKYVAHDTLVYSIGAANISKRTIIVPILLSTINGSRFYTWCSSKCSVDYCSHI